jgi:hypothetical protein
MSKKAISCKEAMDTLKKAMKEDPGYAWSWHCNVAMASIDNGMDPAAANRAASRFMSWAFGVETKEPPRNTSAPEKV